MYHSEISDKEVEMIPPTKFTSRDKTNRYYYPALATGISLPNLASGSDNEVPTKQSIVEQANADSA